jgi:hypothetical protein
VVELKVCDVGVKLEEAALPHPAKASAAIPAMTAVPILILVYLISFSPSLKRSWLFLAPERAGALACWLPCGAEP